MPRKNVLVVDDDPGVIRIMTQMLAGRYEVRTALDGRSALLLACARRPDLVLLDVQFPGENGLSILRELRRFDPDLRVVMLTGDEDPETFSRAINEGARAYVTKPFSLDSVQSVVEYAMG